MLTGYQFGPTPNHAPRITGINKAALRIFGLLPTPQKEEFICLWHEFEEKEHTRPMSQQ
ncbi:HD domain-containing protein [bacterium]|nr:HD domain-containing protein [bacterium]